MAKDACKVTDGLKEIIDQNGPNFLTGEPYKVYLELVQSGNADKKTASRILYLLLNDIQSAVSSHNDSVSLTKLIQSRCSLNKRAAEELADVFLSLYSEKNERDWKSKEREGLSRFLDEEFVCTWKGYAVWDAGSGTVDCYYNAEIVLMPEKKVEKDQKLSNLLKKNPFMTEEAIHKYFEEDLFKCLDDEFEEHCTCDDYYQPVVEDFEIEYCVSEWCRKKGFEIVSCDGDGYDGGFEPKFNKGWY
ncbi:MAG: hypothetical protein Q4D71_09950 [Oscillospiraceae bacterium]|nr:hypothetical protein [Oscillospiraceae bacterium]